ncbi:D-methionine transport system substrate-binding protein [Enterococcus sp. PF1-24]|uniref:MetQ/NlpA family ABC transporter substrate-binding protein n=1 Tax=unclassified Enterococcus TaxID=2608891 RepID=UPI0024759616|nr:MULTISPECIES: MetQ/NlpA family ABC transporter substrate-binding protein [unclassified Enterococcus]MDH6364135.1 D-methionine transport system substrate-binding protein [Enterococcus sp. PFB1-1]MDH6401236.1 D-methionine transport system substrate-binding protein [Enterococcus sp. PF1-24]
MKSWKKIKILILTLGTIALLTACGSKEKATDSTSGELETKVIGVAAGPYGDMVTEIISPLLADEGYQLTTKVFNDYVQPNKALANHQIDGNVFQHGTYLEQFASDNLLELTALDQVPTLGMGLYSKKISDLAEIEEGAQIAIPNDAVNLARALQLLAANDLVELKPEINVAKATTDDIVANPKNLEFKTLEAAQLVRAQDTVVVAVIPGNYSWAAELDPADALALEDLAEAYKNVFVVATEKKDEDFATAVAKVLASQEFQSAIAESEFKDFSQPSDWANK